MEMPISIISKSISSSLRRRLTRLEFLAKPSASIFDFRAPKSEIGMFRENVPSTYRSPEFDRALSLPLEVIGYFPELLNDSVGLPPAFIVAIAQSLMATFDLASRYSGCELTSTINRSIGDAELKLALARTIKADQKLLKLMLLRRDLRRLMDNVLSFSLVPAEKFIRCLLH